MQHNMTDMTSCARALRLLSLNVNGMRIGHKRLTLISESFAPGAPCFPVPTVAANKQYPHGRCCTIARRSDNLQACVCVASCHHFPCVPAVHLCVARLASTFLALWPSCSACVRACCSALGLSLLAHPFGGGAVTEVLHDLLCGFALCTVRHDLP